MKFNNLTHVPDGVFRQQKNLVNLYLDENRIESIMADAFVGLNSLRLLMLGANALRDIALQTLEPLQSLRALNVSHNRLTLNGEQFPTLASILEM